MKSIRPYIVTIAMALSLVLSSPGEASAQSFRDMVIQQLIAQGYYEITSRRTLLGRVRITAENETFYREIVLNPSTGVILRDYWRRKGVGPSTSRIHNPDDDDEGGEYDDDDYDDDDDDDDEDDEDDEDGEDDEDDPDDP